MSKKLLIAFDGLIGSGKTYSAKEICKKHNDFIYFNVNELKLVLANSYLELNKKGFDYDLFEDYLKNFFSINPVITNNKLTFGNATNKNFKKLHQKNIERLFKRNFVQKYINKIINSIIDEYSKNYSIIMIGIDIDKFYKELDYYFIFKAPYKIRKKRMVDVPFLEMKISDHKIANDLSKIKENAITIDTDKLTKHQLLKEIENIIFNEKKDRIIDILFIGDENSFANKLCTECSKKYKEPMILNYTNQFLNNNGYQISDLKRLSNENLTKMFKKQIKDEKAQEKNAQKFIFNEDAIINISYKLNKVSELQSLIQEELKEAEIVFLSQPEKINKYLITNFQKDINKFLDDNSVPYLTLNGSFEEQYKTIESILKRY